MNVLKIAAFCDGDNGGNPAGVAISDELPAESEMRRIAAEVGFSETTFAAATGSGWRVKYFSPESEVPFCGHATIALGAALALEHGDGVFSLTLNHASITVEGHCGGELLSAALQSPPTHSRLASSGFVSEGTRPIWIHQGTPRPAHPPCPNQWRGGASRPCSENSRGPCRDAVRSGQRSRLDEPRGPNDHRPHLRGNGSPVPCAQPFRVRRSL